MRDPTKRPRQRNVQIWGRTIKIIGGEHAFWSDIYHCAMTATFPTLLGAAFAVFIANALFFALLFQLDRSSIAGVEEPHFLGLFFFAIEAFTTVGFGHMYPSDTYGHVVESVEEFFALIQIATLTGLNFARFSRPKARVIFADNPIIAKQDGKSQLMIRFANTRHNNVTGATARLWVLRSEISAEGSAFNASASCR